MNRFYIMTFFMLFFGTSSAQIVKKISLQNAINHSLKNNTNYQNVLLDQEIQNKVTQENIALGLPQLKAKLDYNFAFQQPVTIIPAGIFGPTETEAIFQQPHTINTSILLEQLIFDTRYFYGLKASENIKQAAFLNSKLEKDKLEKEVAIAYYLAVITEESHEKLISNAAVLNNLVVDNQELYKEGLIDELTVNRLELNLSNLQTSIEQAKINHQNALNNLKFLIGFPLEDGIILTDNLESLTAATSRDLATNGSMENRIELQLLKVQDRLIDLNMKQTLSNYHPNLYAFINYGTSAQRNDFNFFNDGRWFQNGILGFNLNVPIFDGLKNHYRAQQIKLEKQQNLNNIENFEKQYSLQVSAAKNDLMVAQSQLASQEKNRALAEKIFYKTNQLFSEGLGSSFELSQAQSDLTTSQINYSQAVYNLIVARYNLKSALKNNN